MAQATTRRVSNSADVAAPAVGISLADVGRQRLKLPPRIVLQGQAGIGKTATAGQAQSPLFLLSPGETGLHTLIDCGILPDVPSLEAKSFDDVMRVVAELTTTEHFYQTLVIDTIDGVEKLCNQHVCDSDFGGDWSEKGFMGYQRGFKIVASGPWRGLLAALDKLRAAKGMMIILLAHTGISNFANPTGPDYNRFTPEMFKDSWAVTFAWADIVLFGQREITVKKEKGDKSAKGYGGDSRVLLTEYSAAADAKNRHNLPPEISMGNSPAEAWQNFQDALNQGRQAGKDVQ